MYIKEWRHAAWRTSLVREGGRVEQGICVVKEDLLGIFRREGAGGREGLYRAAQQQPMFSGI